MKLKTLHLESYGGIKNAEHIFCASYNEKTDKNETGKSTAIEAIRKCIYKFDKQKSYAYLPVDGGGIRAVLELEHFGQEIKIERELSDSGAKAWLTVDGKKKSIKNKETLSEIAMIFGDDFKILEENLWFVDARSIEQHMAFLKTIEDKDIGYLQASGYSGPMIQDVISDLKSNLPKLYTNNANSKSEYAENSRRLEKLRVSLAELSSIENNRAADYASYQDLKLSLKRISADVQELKSKIKETRAQKETNEILLDYAGLLKTRKIMGYDKVKALPPLADYREVQDKINTKKQALEDLNSDLAALEEGIYPVEILDICKDGAKDLSALKRAFSKLLSSKNSEHLIEKEQTNIAVDYGEEALDIDVDRAKTELDTYENRAISMSKTSLPSMLPPAVFVLAALVFAVFGLMFRQETMLLSVCAVSSVVLFATSIYFFSIYYREYKRERRKLDDFDACYLRGDYSEIKKLPRAAEEIKTRLPLNKDARQIIEHALGEISKLNFAKAKLDEDKKTAHSELKELASLNLIDLKDEFKLYETAALYLEHGDRLGEILKTKTRLHEKKLELEKNLAAETKGLNTAKEKYREAFSTRVYAELSSIFEDAKLNERAIDQSLLEASQRNIDLSLEPKVLPVLEDLEVELRNSEESYDESRTKLFKLEHSLETPPVLTNAEYSGFSKEELMAERDLLREENLKIRERYNAIELQIKVLERMEEILKSKLEPAYVNLAQQRFEQIAPSSAVKIIYKGSGGIGFVDDNTAAEIEFSQLSTGTQAQLVLALKLAYLEHEDKAYTYPLIIDDAFMAYDYERRTNVERLLEDISKNRQVIYFSS